jgi:hypothetical protein
VLETKRESIIPQPDSTFALMIRVGQNHIYTVYIWYFGLEITKYTVYIRIYTVLANPTYDCNVVRPPGSYLKVGSVVHLISGFPSLYTLLGVSS